LPQKGGNNDRCCGVAIIPFGTYRTNSNSLYIVVLLPAKLQSIVLGVFHINFALSLVLWRCSTYWYIWDCWRTSATCCAISGSVLPLLLVSFYNLRMPVQQAQAVLDLENALFQLMLLTKIRCCSPYACFWKVERR